MEQKLNSGALDRSRQLPATNKPNREKVKPVIKNPGEIKKKNAFEKFKDTFLGDNLEHVIDYLVGDVVVPAIKDLIANTIIGSVEMSLFGERRTRARGTYSGGSIYTGGTPYNTLYSTNPSANPYTQQARRAANAGVSITYQTDQDAGDVWESTLGIFEEVKSVAVAEVYDLSGMTPSVQDYKHGWYDLRGVTKTILEDGRCVLNFPPPVRLAD